MLMNIYENIDRDKYTFDFVVHSDEKGDFDSRIKELGGHIYRCPKFSMNKIFQYKKWWKCFLREHNEFNIIHSHIRSSAAIYLRIAKKNNIKTIVHSHSTSNGTGFSSFVKRLMQLPLFRMADRCVACSDEAAVWLFGKKVLNSKKYYLVKNSIDANKFAFSQSARDFYRKDLEIDGRIVLIHVGRFHEAKNHMFLLNIFKDLYYQNNKYCLLLVGDGELRPDIEWFVSHYKLSEAVKLLGVRDDIGNLLSASDIFVFPSKWEGLGLSIVEAQANGIRCFISNVIPNIAIVLNDLVTKLPIANGTDVWVDAINKCEYRRTPQFDKFLLSGYDIHSSIETIEKLYEGLFYE